MAMQCTHEFKNGKIVVGTPTNGSSYNPKLWGNGEGIWLDGKKARMIPCEKCANCGKTIVDQKLLYGWGW